jgi:Holliday junction resolvase RusA-like endonuclease
MDIKDLEDGIKILDFFVPGRPATKKTSQRIVRRGRFTKILPSKRYEVYEQNCQEIFESVWKNLGYKPMSYGVGVKLTITLNTWVLGDEVGYMQAIGDILEKYGVIANDQLIHWVDNGVHMITMPNKEAPGAQIEIYRFRHPQETRPNFSSKFDCEDEEDEKTIEKKRKVTKKPLTKRRKKK